MLKTLGAFPVNSWNFINSVKTIGDFSELLISRPKLGLTKFKLDIKS